MTLKELIRRNSWLGVRRELYQFYPDEAINDEGYEAVYCKLTIMEPENSDIQIVLHAVDEEEAEEAPYVDVSGRIWDGNEGNGSGRYESYAIEFKPWEEWLGMKIDDAAFEEFTEPEIIAHCLFEMTFVGFDQREIQKRYEEIIEIAEEIKAITKGEKEGKLIPWEKIKRELGI